MTAANGAKPSSTLTDLTLSVRQESQPEQEVFLQHGLSIGRNPSNAVCIDHPDVERIHAQVIRQADGAMLLECVAEGLSVTLVDGSKVRTLKMSPGATFTLGKATVRCVKRQTQSTVVVTDNPWLVRCPRCHELLPPLKENNRTCEQCSLALRHFRAAPDASGAPGFEGWLPEQVGPYRIRAFIAAGGMGIVLRALHQDTDRAAAIKLLRMDDEGDSAWKQRFRAEIDTLKSLRHPNAVHLQDDGQDQRLLWLAMDWIDGQPLSKWAMSHQGPDKFVPLDAIRDVLVQVVAGLSYLHGRQIIHRDLKPGNILVCGDGLVKMVDFGIAKAAAGSNLQTTRLTHTGMVAGTETYMSPEQAEGQAVTTASDIFSLGVIWYELVTGRRPLGAFVPPNLIRPDCPPLWNQAISACLSPSASSRPTLSQLIGVINSSGGASTAPIVVPTGLTPAGGLQSPVTGAGAAAPPAAGQARGKGWLQVVGRLFGVAGVLIASIPWTKLLRMKRKHAIITGAAVLLLGGIITTVAIIADNDNGGSSLTGGGGESEPRTLEEIKAKAKKLFDAADYSGAMRLYKKAADEMNDAESMKVVGDMLVAGQGAPADARGAGEYYFRAGKAYAAKGQDGLAFACYRDAAQREHVPAMEELARCYDTGKGCIRSQTEAGTWFFNTGYAYANGQGIQQDYHKAFAMYTEGARCGNALAMNNLGVMYDRGDGLNAPDPVRAAFWFEKSAQKNNAVAMTNLGHCYRNGRGVARNLIWAEYWYRKAAATGNAEAREALRQMGYQ